MLTIYPIHSDDEFSLGLPKLLGCIKPLQRTAIRGIIMIMMISRVMGNSWVVVKCILWCIKNAPHHDHWVNLYHSLRYCHDFAWKQTKHTFVCYRFQTCFKQLFTLQQCSILILNWKVCVWVCEDLRMSPPWLCLTCMFLNECKRKDLHAPNPLVIFIVFFYAARHVALGPGYLT